MVLDSDVKTEMLARQHNSAHSGSHLFLAAQDVRKVGRADGVERVDLVSTQVGECLGGKGGGRSGRYQGKAPELTQTQVQAAVKHMTAVTLHDGDWDGIRMQSRRC